MANIRTKDYGGWNHATGSAATGSGFIIWSGSMQLSKSDASQLTQYYGVGIEAIAHSGSYLRFQTDTDNNQTSALDIKTNRFFLGSDAAFISGSGDGTIAISSSNFELNEAGAVVMQGQITATAGGTIGGFAIGTNTLTGTNFVLDTSNERLTLGTSNDIVIADANEGLWVGNSSFASAPFRVGLAGAVTASAGNIAGWTLGANTLTSQDNRVRLNANAGDGGTIAIYKDASSADDFVGMFYVADSAWGLQGKTGGNLEFQLGSTNQIAGWTFDNEKFVGGNLSLFKEGSIKSNNYVSNFSGFALTAASGGFLEVENAKIRGTLSTAVFEKETVNAVGGQLYVANSTALTGSVITGQANQGGLYAATDTTMSVVNVTGFAAGEILSMKRVNATGFQTEYVKVVSSSRHDSSSEINFAGNLMVTRAYGNGVAATAVSQSLGNIPGGAQPYSGSQVVVSTGKIGTGFIRLNANPNDQTTPYIDIVERTGSGVYDLSLKTRLGDLSGINDPSFSDNVTGFGIYTENGYFKGKIEVTNPDGDSMNQNFGGPSGSIVPVTKLVPDGELTGSQWYQSATLRHRVENGRLLVSGSSFAWTHELRSKQKFNRSGDHSFITDFTVLYDGAKAIFFGVGAAAKYTWEGSYPTTAYSNLDHAVYINNNDGIIYEHGVGASLSTTGLTNAFVAGTKHRMKITPNLDGGARYQFWLHPNLSASYYDNTSAADASTGELLDWGMTPNSSTVKLEIENIQVTAPGQMSTVIEGDKITTGKILSTNWGSSAGSELDLDAGTIKLGGYSSPLFEVDTSGHVSASAGSIGGFTLGPTSFAAGTSFQLSSSTNASDPVSFISSSNFKVSADGRVTASGANITGNITVTNTGDFAGPSLYENFQSTLDNTKWMTGSLEQLLVGSTDDGADYSGSKFSNENASSIYTSGFASNQVFQRANAPSLEYDFVTNEQYNTTHLGFVSGDLSLSQLTTANHSNFIEEGIRMSGGNFEVWSDTDNNDTCVEIGADLLGSAAYAQGSGEEDAFWKLRITLKPEGGARYAMYKNGDLTSPFSSYDSTGNTRPDVKVAVLVKQTNPVHSIIVGQLGVSVPIQTTRISGNSISTGKIQSNVVTATAGSEIDLNNGTMALGGSIAANSASLEFKNDILKIRSGSDVTFDSSTAAFDGSNMGKMLTSMRTISPTDYPNPGGIGTVIPAGGSGRPGSDFVFNPTDEYLVVLYSAAAYHASMNDGRFMIQFNFELFDPALAHEHGGSDVQGGDGDFRGNYTLSEAIGKFAKTENGSGQYDGPFSSANNLASENQGFAAHAPGMLIIEHNSYDNDNTAIPLQGMVIRPWLTANWHGNTTTTGTVQGNSTSKNLYIEGVTYYGCNTLQLERMIQSMTPNVTKTYYTGSLSHKQYHGRYANGSWIQTVGGE